MTQSRTRSLLVAALLTAGMMMSTSAARADDMASATARRDAQMAACGKLMPSNREICVLQAQGEYDRAVTQLRSPTVNSDAVATVESTYAKNMAACGRLIDSNKDICRTQAQAQRSNDMSALAAASRGTVIGRSDQAIIECARLPVSEREVCVARFNSPPVTVVPSG